MSLRDTVTLVRCFISALACSLIKWTQTQFLHHRACASVIKLAIITCESLQQPYEADRLATQPTTITYLFGFAFLAARLHTSSHGEIESICSCFDSEFGYVTCALVN